MEWVSEWGMWISLCDVGEVRVANVGSDASGVDSRFFSCYESNSRGDTMGGGQKGPGGESTSSGWSSSTAGAEEDTVETFVDRVFLTVFWILVDAAFLGLRT